MAANLLRLFHALATEKQAVRKREDTLIADLRPVLGDLGYRLEPIGANASPRRTTSPRPGRMASRSSKQLRCDECGRTFALPLHLGRHASVMHKGKRAAAPQATSPTAEKGSAKGVSAKATPRRRRMNPAARRAVARRMKAYWGKRRAAGARKKGRRVA
jgi:hypothetical protein